MPFLPIFIQQNSSHDTNFYRPRFNVFTEIARFAQPDFHSRMAISSGFFSLP
jgi:hypothetical protein